VGFLFARNTHNSLFDSYKFFEFLS
jgi:hypothetical protein